MVSKWLHLGLTTKTDTFADLGFMGEGVGKGALGQPPPFPPFGAMPERKHEFKKELFLFTMIISRKCTDVFKKEEIF